MNVYSLIVNCCAFFLLVVLKIRVSSAESLINYDLDCTVKIIIRKEGPINAHMNKVMKDAAFRRKFFDFQNNKLHFNFVNEFCIL